MINKIDERFWRWMALIFTVFIWKIIYEAVR